MKGGRIVAKQIYDREPAHQPDDLARLFIKRANAGDAEGLAALYEPDAVLALPPGRVARGRDVIREFYAQLLATPAHFALEKQLPTLVLGDLALTATRLPGGGATAEVARRQPDGTWLWMLDRPSFRE